jgi:hypothetical protein
VTPTRVKLRVDKAVCTRRRNARMSSWVGSCSKSLSEKYQAASRLSLKRVIATYTKVSLVVGNSS